MKITDINYDKAVLWILLVMSLFGVSISLNAISTLDKRVEATELDISHLENNVKELQEKVSSLESRPTFYYRGE